MFVIKKSLFGQLGTTFGSRQLYDKKKGFGIKVEGIRGKV